MGSSLELWEQVGPRVGLQPSLGVLGESEAPQAEDLVAPGLVESEQPRLDHVECHSGEVVGREPCEDTDECNDCRCYRIAHGWLVHNCGLFPGRLGYWAFFASGSTPLLFGGLSCWSPP